MMTAKSQQFLNELAQFYRNKGQQNVTPNNFIVRINGKPVNLWDLYSSVIDMGGSYKVNQYNRWDEIYLKLFKTQSLGANVSVAVRQIYQKYLISYEKANYSNFISDSIDNDDDENVPNKDFSLGFSFLNNNSLSSSQSNQQLLNNVANINPLNKLFCSLMSDLPNEMDFGLRVATILTNSKEIDNLADFKFIDVILECCVLYTCSCEETAYSSCSDYNFSQDQNVNENYFDQNSKEQNEVKSNFSQKQNKSVSNKFTETNVRKFLPFKDCNCFLKFWCQMCKSQNVIRLVFDIKNEDIDALFDEEICQQEHKKNYYKIKRVAELLKNLSYSIEKLRVEQSYDNEEYFKIFSGLADNASLNLLRFLILLLNSNDQSLINIALDIISNISPLVNANMSVLDQNYYVKLLMKIYKWCVHKVLFSSDVNCLNRCLEIVSKLVNSNHEAINRLIIAEILNQKEFFYRITELLTCQHDVGIVVSALECCLSLSENYPKLLLNENKHLIKVLMSLVNCEEGQFFSLNSIKKVKIIDERTVYVDMNSQQGLVPNNFNNTNQKNLQYNELNNPAVLADNEAHVKNWFLTNFEPRGINNFKKNTLKLQEIYSDYVKFSCVNGRKNVVTTLAFSQLMKKYFPSCSIINSNEIEGLCFKASSNNLTSPILKAHLSTPPKITSNVQIVSSNVISNGQNSASASPLIKNLLANKLRNNQTSLVTINSNQNVDELKPSNLLPQNITLVTNNLTDSSQNKPTCIVQQQTSNVLITNPNNQNFANKSNSNNGPNIISLPLQQHIIPSTSSSMIINTNQLTSTGTMVVPGTGGQQQFLLVRTIMPQQNNLVVGNNQNVPVRFILPASVLTSQSSIPQTITINGTNSSQITNCNNNSSFFYQQSEETKLNTDNKSINNQNSFNQPNDSYLKSVLNSNCDNVSTPIKNKVSNVKSSPLLNVLLDKGKLPEFSTTTNFLEETSQDNKSSSLNSEKTNPVNNQCQVTNNFVVNQSQASNNSSLTNSQVVTSTMSNTSPTKMFILTTTKSPLSIKNGNNVNNTNSSIKSFVLQQPNSNNQTNFNEQTTQIVLQPNNSNLLNSQSQVILSQQQQQVIVHQSSTNLPTIENQSTSNNCLQNKISLNTIVNNTHNSSNDNSVDSLSVNSISNKINSEENLVNNNKSESVDKLQETVAGTNSIKTDKTVEITNCIIKKNDLSLNKSLEKKDEELNMNGFLEKSNHSIQENNLEIKQVEENKNSLLKRQLEMDDFCNKKTKLESQVTIIPVQTTVENNLSKQIKNEPNSKNMNENSNDLSNLNFDKTDSLPKNQFGCTIEKVTITKKASSNTPILSNENSETNLKNKSASNKIEYICEWSNCKQSFKQASSVFLHVHKDHINPMNNNLMTCLWGGSEGMGPGCKALRPKYSLLTHLQDFHCSVHNLQQSALRNQQLTNKGTSDIPQIVPPAHPGYANNAAIMAIRRHAVNFIENKPVVNISPLSKSVRLTAAMILRNLAQHSNLIKKSLKNYESFLSELCIFDGREDSRTLAQCLAVITEEN